MYTIDYKLKNLSIKIENLGAGEMTGQLRAHASLTKDLNSGLCIHIG